MFELTLSTTIDKQRYLGEFFSRFGQEIRGDSGVVVNQNSNGRAYLAIAVDEAKKEYYKAKILDYILFVIVDDYKYNFYKDNLTINEDSVVFKSFLKAISIFDAENDKDIIKSQIQLSGEILIDSFFYFKLQLIIRFYMTNLAPTTSTIIHTLYIISFSTFYQIIDNFP